MAKYSRNIVSLGKVIFKFTSKKKNLCYKLVVKTYNGHTGEIDDNDSLITEEIALQLNKEFGIDIKDLDDEESFKEFEEKELEESEED